MNKQRFNHQIYRGMVYTYRIYWSRFALKQQHTFLPTICVPSTYLMKSSLDSSSSKSNNSPSDIGLASSFTSWITNSRDKSVHFRHTWSNEIYQVSVSSVQSHAQVCISLRAHLVTCLFVVQLSLPNSYADNAVNVSNNQGRLICPPTTFSAGSLIPNNHRHVSAQDGFVRGAERPVIGWPFNRNLVKTSPSYSVMVVSHIVL